jgi:ketosteroid isomerase-like protein
MEFDPPCPGYPVHLDEKEILPGMNPVNQNPQETGAAQAEVWDVVVAFNRAFAENDPERYFALLDDGVSVITPGSPYRVEGLAADREGFEFALREGHGQVGYFQALQPSVQVLGEAAVVTYYSRGSYGPEGKGRMLYLKETDVLARREGGWKIVHIHVSATPPG